jgi:hypothetical protein
MSQRSSAGQIALLTTGVIVTGFLGYAVYFDYQRRNSASFRKGIRALFLSDGQETLADIG